MPSINHGYQKQEDGSMTLVDQAVKAENAIMSDGSTVEENIGNTNDTLNKMFKSLTTAAKNITQAVFANSAIHKKLKELIQSKDNNFTGGKGDEGGWIPNITNDTALEIQAQACEEVGNELGIAIKPSLDFAALLSSC